VNEPSGQKGSGDAQSFSESSTILDLWIIVRRRRSFILRFTVVLICLGVMASIFMTRQYTSTGEIQIQKDSSDSLGIDSLTGSAGAGAVDALDANITLQTQAKILESQTLGLQVVEKLHLEGTSDFHSRFSPIGWLMGLMAPKGPSDGAHATLENSPNRRDHLLRIFRTNTKVAPVAGTRLIDISYTSADPKIAAAVVNELIVGLTDYTFQTRYNSTSQTSEWLGKQLSDLRASSEELQARVADLQRSSGVFTFGGQDLQGKLTVYSPILDELQQTTATLSQASSNRVIKGALYEAAKAGDPEMISALASSSSLNGASPAVGNSLALIQTLRSQQAAQKALYSEVSDKFGPNYPKLEEMSANLTSLQGSIAAEQARLLKQTQSDFAVAQQVEESSRQIFEGQKHDAEALNDKAIQYQMLRQESEQSRDLYQRLLSKLKEAGVLESLRSSNVTVVEPGRVSSKPSKPNTKLYIFGALFGGLFFGVVGAFALEIFDDTVNDPRATAEIFGDSFLGDMPYERQLASRVDGSSSISGLAPSGSPYREAVRDIRTALLFPAIGEKPRTILATSPLGGEGKSSFLTNLAALSTVRGEKILLIDADLRTPTLHAIFNLPNEQGLTAMLDSKQPIREIATRYLQPVAAIPGLFVLPAGPLTEDPAQLLGSNRMADLLSWCKENFSITFLDGSPILSVTDAIVLVSNADRILLVARENDTRRVDLDRSYQLLLARASRATVSVVLNEVKRTPKKPAAKRKPLRPSYFRRLLRFGGTSALFMFASLHLRAQTESLLIGHGDLLHVQFYDTPEMDQHPRVDDHGFTSLLFLGRVSLAGLTPEEASSSIRDIAVSKGIMRHPQVVVSIEQYATQAVTISGEVNHPGAYPISTPRSVLDLLSMAGGIGALADRHVLIRHHDTTLPSTPYFVDNDPDQTAESSVRVLPGDTILVRRVGFVYILGDVARPGGYPMANNESGLYLLQAIALGGSLNKTAYLSGVKLLRKTKDGYLEIPVHLDDIQKGKCQDVPLQPDDVLFIPFSYAKSFALNATNVAASVASAALYKF
jgi:polysaccharide biosynthesis transport protein